MRMGVLEPGAIITCTQTAVPDDDTGTAYDAKARSVLRPTRLRSVNLSISQGRDIRFRAWQ